MCRTARRINLRLREGVFLAVGAFSYISNPAAGRTPSPMSPEAVLEMGRQAGLKIRSLWAVFIKIYQAAQGGKPNATTLGEAGLRAR